MLKVFHFAVFISSALCCQVISRQSRSYDNEEKENSSIFGFNAPKLLSERKTPRQKMNRNAIPNAPEDSDFILPDTYSEMQEFEDMTPACEKLEPVSNGYSKLNRRGYTKLTNGIFCSRGNNAGSKCIMICNKGSKLFTLGNKRFRCKCTKDKCEWTKKNFDGTLCKNRQAVEANFAF